MPHLRYPNESAEYRKARNALLTEEMALRRQIEAVAAQRRALPPGGEVPEDYRFERIRENAMPERVEMSKLFGRHRTLILYSFMYGPERDTPCPMCTPGMTVAPRPIHTSLAMVTPQGLPPFSTRSGLSIIRLRIGKVVALLAEWLPPVHIKQTLAAIEQNAPTVRGAPSET